MLRTWLSIGPAVLAALLIVAAVDFFFSDPRPTPLHMLQVMVLGGVMMLAVVPFGQRAWMAAFRDRILDPLREVGTVMSKAGEGDLTATRQDPPQR